MDLAGAKSEALDNIYSLLKQNIKSCYAKRRRQREREKTTIGLFSNCSCSTLGLYISLICRCFARPQRETSKKFLITRFMEEMSYLLLFTFFTRSFSPWWALGFFVYSPPVKNFHVLPTNSSLTSALAYCRSFSR